MLVDASGGGGNGSKIPGNALAAQASSMVKPKESAKSVVRSSVSVLATELECALLQVMICRDQDSSSSISGTSGVTSPANEAARYSPLPSKDSGSDITQVNLQPCLSSFHGPWCVQCFLSFGVEFGFNGNEVQFSGRLFVWLLGRAAFYTECFKIMA